MTADGIHAAPPTARLLLGVGVFVLGWIVTLAMVPLVIASSLSPSAQATISGIVVFVGPKLGVLAAIAIMGKPGFVWLKSRVFGYLKPPAEVSPARHRIGIAMFVAAMVLSFVEPVAIVLPDLAGRGFLFSYADALLLLVSILVLGGDFWDKSRALFIRDAKVQFPVRD